MANQTDTSDSLPLNKNEKIWAGSLLIFFTLAALTTLLAYWPDRVPKGACNIYSNKAFHITLLCTHCPVTSFDSVMNLLSKERALANEKGKAQQAGDASQGQVGDKAKQAKPAQTDSAKLDSAKKADADKKLEAEKKAAKLNEQPNPKKPDTAYRANTCLGKGCIRIEENTIQLNTLILILVVAAGFLGNMIYVCKSFTAFVGVGEFNRNWILWYFVKPFTAAGLALIVYFALNDDSDIALKAVNLKGIVAVAALTGLFTDMAMLKLKDIFEVIIKPNEDKTLKPPIMKIDLKGIKPAKIIVGQPNDITITGENLDAKKLIIKVNDQVITNAIITPALIKFTYEVAEVDRAKTEFKLVITDKGGNELANFIWGV